MSRRYYLTQNDHDKIARGLAEISGRQRLGEVPQRRARKPRGSSASRTLYTVAVVQSIPSAQWDPAGDGEHRSVIMDFPYFYLKEDVTSGDESEGVGLPKIFTPDRVITLEVDFESPVEVPEGQYFVGKAIGGELWVVDCNPRLLPDYWSES